VTSGFGPIVLKNSIGSPRFAQTKGGGARDDGNPRRGGGATVLLVQPWRPQSQGSVNRVQQRLAKCARTAESSPTWAWEQCACGGPAVEPPAIIIVTDENHEVKAVQVCE
jgi:hypothetical protein